MTAGDTLRHTEIPIGHGLGTLPALGFGTLLPDPSLTGQAVKTALQVGFRHLDCAERYRNEDAVGEALKEAFSKGPAQTRGCLHNDEALEQRRGRGGQWPLPSALPRNERKRSAKYPTVRSIAATQMTSPLARRVLSDAAFAASSVKASSTVDRRIVG